jgi:hypothetical protein
LLLILRFAKLEPRSLFCEVNMALDDTRSYRCSYHPKEKFDQVALSETGALPSIQLKAKNATQAEMLAWATTGCPIASVERLDEQEVV